MRQVLIETIPFSISPVQLTEGMRAPSGNPMVEGILATAEVKNGNGRYYSKDLWEREIDKYQEVVDQNRACGELDHPQCFIDGYKILTLGKGWVEFKDLQEDEKVATLNTTTRELIYQPILKIINQYYEGDIINIESKTFQANVTPNHRFIVENYDKSKLIFKTAEDFYLTKGNGLIPKISQYNCDKKEIVNIENKSGKLEIPSSIFASFMGWWLAEGWLHSQSYIIYISQLKKENFNEIENILKNIGELNNLKWGKRNRKNNEIEYNLSSKVLHTYLSQFGLCNQKFIPKEIKELDKENIQLFLDTYLKADGTKQKNQKVS